MLVPINITKPNAGVWGVGVCVWGWGWGVGGGADLYAKKNASLLFISLYQRKSTILNDMYI